MFKINLKKSMILITLILILISSISIVFASDIDLMTIKGGSFSTDGGLEDKTYASIYVGEEYAGEDVIIQIFYSRDGSLLNHGNLVPKTVNYYGYIEVASADSYAYFPDYAEINLYDTNNNLLDSESVSLSPSSGKQTFGVDSYTSSSYSSSSSSSGGSSGNSGHTSYNSGTSSSYVGNSNSGKFHAPGCGDVNKMKPSNKVYFSSREEAISSGYSPCGHCNP